MSSPDSWGEPGKTPDRGRSDLSLKEECELIRETSIYQAEGAAGTKAWRLPGPPQVLLSGIVEPAHRMWMEEGGVRR